MSGKISGAQQYHSVNDLWVISSFFNSNEYHTKPKNFDLFIEKIEAAHIHYLILECAFGEQNFTLKKSPNILQVRCKDVMWQKERLLNIALENLPDRCKKVAWIDCDVLFENPDWAVETSAKLDHYQVVQPFKEAIRLPKNALYYEDSGERYDSFAYVYNSEPDKIHLGRFNDHGHTGFAWASHKEILLKHGFYDVCIAGSGDHMMAHSFTGYWDSKCMHRLIGKNPAFFQHYADWSARVFEDTKASISYVDGTLLHLWHGDFENRKYVERQKALENNLYNPSTDIILDEAKCWQWNQSEDKFQEWAENYFVSRKEDGD